MYVLWEIQYRRIDIIMLQCYQGEQGDRGDKGDDGVPGAPGLPGEPGRDGLTGLKGEKVQRINFAVPYFGSDRFDTDIYSISCKGSTVKK